MSAASAILTFAQRKISRMEMVKKISRSLLIGCFMGLITALFTNFFFKPLIDRLENQTYDMRYIWEFDETFNPLRAKEADKEFGYGIHIIDIDDRSLQKLGAYWHWDRSFHAKLINSLGRHFPAALIFDILFYDPEDDKYRERLDKLLARSQEINSFISFKDGLRQKIVSTINYDEQFIDAAQKCAVAYFGVRMSNKTDYPQFALSQIEPRMTMEWHRALCPSSTISFADSLRKEVVNPGNSKPVIDGIFPALAQAARDIGYVNMVPDKDGVIRRLPIFYAFGEHEPIYLPLSVRVAASLFATPANEISLTPNKCLDLGKPFKIFKDAQGGISFSYPNVTVKQIRAIIDNAQRILALRPGEIAEVSSLIKIGRDSEGGPFIDLYCGRLPREFIPLCTALRHDSILKIAPGDFATLAPNVNLLRSGADEWTLTAPYGDGEYIMSSLDLKTLSRIDSSDYADIEPGKVKLLFHQLSVKNISGILVSTIPTLRAEQLRELCLAGWSAIQDLPPGSRMEFGKNVRIPLGKNNEHIITYFGPKGRPFPRYSYYDIMEDRIQGALEGRIFIVGSTAPDMFDIKPVPHDNTFPAVEIHANLLNSFLTNTFVTRMEGWRNFLVLLGVGILIGFIALLLKPLHGALLSLLAVFVHFLIAMTLFGSYHLWIDIARPVLTIILTFTACMVYRYITEEKDRKFLQNTFKAYLSPELIDIMYKNRQMPTLGGEEGVRTAYFTDIQGFSTFSEKLGSPTRLVELLNEYLSAMTDILMANYGTLDKYEGDAIIAFFGAPMPMQNHAQAACNTALGMQKRLGELRRKWQSEGDKWPRIVHEMRMRIGVNTGPLVTGNMGSRMRMNYTMMGDAVNLAARLESASKQYGVYTMISQTTWDIVHNEFEGRPIDKVTVVGKSEPVVIYELIAKKGELDEIYQRLLPKYMEALSLYYAQKWDQAISLLKECDQIEPYREIAPKGATPSNILAKRAEEYKKAPPGNAWDGVYRLTSK